MLGRPVLSFWRLFIRPVLALSSIFVPLALLGWLNDNVGFAFVGILPATAYVTALALRGRYIWKLAWRVRRFRTLTSEHAIIHYDSRIDFDDIDDVHRFSRTSLNRLAEWFGSPLRGRVTIFVFASNADVARIRGRRCGGFAVPEGHLVAISCEQNIQGIIEHELAHLFAARLKLQSFAPALLCEGLAVWCEAKADGYPLDRAATSFIQRTETHHLTKLLCSNYFFSDERRAENYLLAGSFTGFLIRTYGWDKYRVLYKKCDYRRPLKPVFEKIMGDSFDRAEWRWRNELLVPLIIRQRMGVNLRGRAS